MVYEADCVAVDAVDSDDHPDEGEEEHGAAAHPPAETPLPESLAAALDSEVASSQVAAQHGLLEVPAKHSPGGKLYFCKDTGRPLGALHEVFGTSLKATCRVHPGQSCNLFVHTAGRYHPVRNALIEWVATGKDLAPPEHKRGAADIKTNLGVRERA